MVSKEYILDPKEASNGTKFWLTIVTMVLICGGAGLATYSERFAKVYFEFGELLLAASGLYFSANVGHKWIAGNVNGKYRRKTDDDESLPRPSKW